LNKIDFYYVYYLVTIENNYLVTIMEDDTVLRLDCVDSYTNIPCTTQKIIISNYKDKYYSKLKIPFGCKLYYEEDKELTLLYACSNYLRETAIGMISNNQVDDVGKINKSGETALILACSRSMSDVVAILLIKTFGDKCNPQQVNRYGNTALIWACYMSMSDVATLLITSFGDKCNPQQLDSSGCTALMWACHMAMSDVAVLLITTFGDKCNPQQVNDDGKTALLLACDNSMSDVATLLITTFGDKCNPQQVNPYGETTLSLASKNKMNDVVVLLKQFS
jgi:ankyrin repeat protein